MCRAAISLLLFASVAFGAAAQDTVRLAARLQMVRGKKLLTNAEYRTVRDEYLKWLDSRIQTGRSVESMNQELHSAGLLPRPKMPDEPAVLQGIYASHVGYVDKISTRFIRPESNTFVVVAAMYKGDGCSLDVTALIYQRQPLKRLAMLNADTRESPYAYQLSGIAMDNVGPNRERIVASGGSFRTVPLAGTENGFELMLLAIPAYARFSCAIWMQKTPIRVRASVPK
jgi:hypothetical protein